MSSSTSNSKKLNKDEQSWRGFFKNLLLSFVGICLFIYAAIVLVDPFDVLMASIPLDRAPMATNQRFSYPALARNEKFNSVVIGSSSVRLFRPELMNNIFDAKFVNLAANAARPYEQYRFLKLFMEHHPNPKVVLFGIDIKNEDMWCRLDELKKFTGRKFPEWMYDDNKWNDFLHHFNAKALEITGRQMAQVFGFLEPRFGRDGFANFTPNIDEYNIEKARGHIYGGNKSKTKPLPEKTPSISEGELVGLDFPAIVYIDKMLELLPKDTIKILHFVPRHWYVQPQKNTKDALVLQECKSRIINAAEKHEENHVFDFMIESPITTKDSNYWDDIHHTINIADEILFMIGKKVNIGKDKLGYYLYN